MSCSALVLQLAGNAVLGNPTWLKVPGWLHCSLRITVLSATAASNPPTTIYCSFQSTCRPPELCVRADLRQPQINITFCLMNGGKKKKKEMQGIHLEHPQHVVVWGFCKQLLQSLHLGVRIASSSLREGHGMHRFTCGHCPVLLCATCSNVWVGLGDLGGLLQP